MLPCMAAAAAKLDGLMIFPSRFYGDPAEVCDERRKLTELAARRDEITRRQKRRKIQRLTRIAMKGRY